MRIGPILLGTILVATFASGCLDNGSATEAGKSRSHEGAAAHDHGLVAGMKDHKHFDLALLEGFKVEFKNCKEAGGVSLYDMAPDGRSGPTKDFKLHSIQDDTGNPKIMSYGKPNTMGGSSGIWHISLVCEKIIYNGEDLGPFEGGWVGQRVHPPAWDDGTILRQYMVADLSFNKGDIVDLIHHATGLHASRNLDSKVDFVGPAMHTILDDEDHGVFETHGSMKAWTPKDSMDHMRFWMLINPAGHGHQAGEGSNPKCECIPIAFDVENTPGKYQVIDGTGWLSHTRTDAHGATPGAAGNVGGMSYTGFDRTFTIGPLPDITVAQTWLH